MVEIRQDTRLIRRRRSINWPVYARRALALLGFGAVGLGGCAGNAHASAPLSCNQAQNWEETGTASWYGDGDLTASGEAFDRNGLTVAHPRLPFGTRVKVTNLKNGLSATFTVNDRGPFVDGRVVDVSRRGAGMLGFRKSGTAPVRVEVIETC